MVERVSEKIKARIAVLCSQDASGLQIREDTGVNRHVVFRQTRRLSHPAKAAPVRSVLRSSMVEREEISLGLAGGESLRSIARRLGRGPSRVSRELTRNGGRRRYRACRADRDAIRRACSASR